MHTPFHLAVKNCHIPVIHTLLEAGCDPNITDHVRLLTYFHPSFMKLYLSLHSCVSVFFLFIQHTQMGQTALHIAAEMGKVDVVEMILKAEVDLEIQDRVTDRV